MISEHFKGSAIAFFVPGYLTMSASHSVAWMRALEHGCPNPLADKEQIPVQKSDPVWDLIQNGWTWRVLKSQVEEQWPDLPSWLQYSMNSSNQVGRATNELELASQIATFIQGGKSLEDATTLVSQGLVHTNQMRDIAHYVKLYAGGQQFELLKFLKTFSQHYGATLLMGQDFFHGLARAEFKADHTTVFPHMRTAMWATGLTTSKTSDGIQKLLQKSDIDRLKNATLFPNMQKAEDMLKDCWSMTKAASAMSAEDHRVATKAFGLVCIRLTLHLLSKEKHARESRKFDTMEEIVSQFGQDLKKSPAPAPSSSTSTTVANLLVAKPKDIALLQHSHIELNELHLDISVFLLELIFLVQHFSNTISTRCFSFDNLFWCLLSISGMPTRKSMARKFSN